MLWRLPNIWLGGNWLEIYENKSSPLSTHFKTCATVFGPNHSPTRLSSESPINAIWWRENGHFLASSKRLTIFRYVGSRVSVVQNQLRPKCRSIRLWARTIWPHRSMQPHPLSVVSCASPSGTKPRLYVHQSRERMSWRIRSSSGSKIRFDPWGYASYTEYSVVLPWMEL